MDFSPFDCVTASFDVTFDNQFYDTGIPNVGTIAKISNTIEIKINSVAQPFPDFFGSIYGILD